MIQKLQILNLLFYIIIAFIISFVLITVSLILNKKTKKFNNKLISYETGCLPTSDNQIQLNINFYIIAIIFLILDIEIILMFPWVLSLKIIGLKAYYKTLFLFLILALGFIFEWFNNSLNWVK